MSNAVYNPNESLHPPPTSRGADERDSDMEKYIRRKYETGAFKAAANPSGVAPTSLNRAREKEGREVRMENRRDPELNDVLFKKGFRERELPALPTSAGVGGGARSRPRPMRAVSAQGGGQAKLVEVEGGMSSTLPLQINATGSSGGGFQPKPGPSGSGGMNRLASAMWSTSPQPQHPSMGYSSLKNGQSQQHFQHSYSAPPTTVMDGFSPQQFQQQQSSQQYQNFLFSNQTSQSQHFPQQLQYNSSSSPFPQQTYTPHQQYPAASYPESINGFHSPQYTQQQSPYGNEMTVGTRFPQQNQQWGTMGTGMR